MKISVIGSGSVGIGICNYLLTLGNISELVLYSRNADKVEGEAWDYLHTEALTFSKHVTITAARSADQMAESDIVVITAGEQIKVDQPRVELAEINSRIAVNIVRQLESRCPNAIIIVVTNPCDIIAHSIIRNTSFPASRVISSGCVIDTARLMSIIGERVDLDPKNVFGYVLGEHGSHCFAPKSLISIAGQPADSYCRSNGLDIIDPEELLQAVKRMGFEIFKRKGNTTHGISASVFRIIQAISIHERSVLPVGALLEGQYGLEDVVLSVPCVVGKNGIERILVHPFSEDEAKTLCRIASAVGQQLASLPEF